MTYRFQDLPHYRELLEKAVKVLRKDERVRALYLSGSLLTDEYSDIDLMILSTREDAQELENERFEIASKVGKIRAEVLGRPRTYVVVYEPFGIKVDYCFHFISEKPRPDKANIEILYDPDGILSKLVEDSTKLNWNIDLDVLENHVKHFFVVLAYFVTKVERGELWEGRDTVEWYRGRLVMIEDILAQRKNEGYRRIETKLDNNRMLLLQSTVPRSVELEEIYRCMDVILEYFKKFLQPDLEKLGVYPEDYARRMLNQYFSRKNIL